MNQTELLPTNRKSFRQNEYGNLNNLINVREKSQAAAIANLRPNSNSTVITQVSLNPASIIRVLTTSAFILIIASTAAEITDYLTGHSSVFLHKLVKLLYVDFELNIPAFFSMILLLSAASLLAVITFLKHRQKADYVFQWAILAGGFFFMAFDEIVAVHERLIEPMREILGGGQLGVLYFAWVVPAFAIVSFLAVFFLKFLWSLPVKTRVSFMIAATIYLGAAIGLELIEGVHSEIYGKDNLPYILLTTVEESLEMIGIIAFIWALLEYFADICKQVQIRFDDFGI